MIAFVAHYGFPEQVQADIECAIGEALANAAEHGFREGSTFDVFARVVFPHLVIDVQDDGPGFPHAALLEVEEPPVDSPRGFGIFIMRRLMDEIAYSDSGRCVTLKKRLPNLSTAGEPSPGHDLAFG